jgi:hypothetical protein
MSATLRSRPLTGGRLAAVIGGATALTLAVLLALAGTGLLWADSRKDDGYFSTTHERLTTTSYAIATDDLEIEGDAVGDALYGKVRLELDGAQPVFAGIARTSDVDAYLAGSAHTTLSDLEIDPFRPEYRDALGTGAPGRPGDETFWAAKSETGTLTWDVEDGDWSVVLMNADGSKGVDARVSAGASVPFLDDLGYGLSIASLALLILGGALIGEALRRQRQPSSPDGSASAA